MIEEGKTVTGVETKENVPAKVQAAQTPPKRSHKKLIVILSACVVLAALAFAAYHFCIQPVQSVEEKIEKIGTVETFSGPTIKNARTAFDALPGYLQKRVKSAATLPEAEKKYKEVYCLFLVNDASNYVTGVEVKKSFSGNTLTIVENSTNINYYDVMVLGGSVVGPIITSSSREVKNKVDSAGFTDVDVVIEFQVSGVTIATAKNGVSTS